MADCILNGTEPAFTLCESRRNVATLSHPLNRREGVNLLYCSPAPAGTDKSGNRRLGYRHHSGPGTMVKLGH